MKWLAWLALAALPFVVHSNFILTIVVFSFILGMAAVSFNVIFGFTGQLSMFHAASFGLSAYAMAQNPEAAMLRGVRTNLMQTGVVVYSCALAGFGGALYASLYSLEPAMGGLYILKGVEAAILGGVGSLAGSLVGGVIIGVTEAIGSIYLPNAFRDAYGLVFVIVILLFKPSGLFGKDT